MNAWLADNSRQLTKEQFEIVISAFQKCPLPLFLRLCFGQAVSWKSYSKVDNLSLQNNVKDEIDKLFDRVELLRGRTIVSHALAYLTASYNGLSDSEMDDILSLDDEVLQEVYQYWTPPLRRIPPMLWQRIRSDLNSYMVLRGADGTPVNMWYHRQFIEAAERRYLSDESKMKKYHELMSEYFSGTWSNGRKKPYTIKKDGKEQILKEDRIVPAQPNNLGKDNEEGVFNYRKLRQLPKHLISCGNVDQLKNQILFNFDFMYCKFLACGYWEVMKDSEEALVAFPNDKEVKLIYEFLMISGNILQLYPSQLACQLVGRLFDSNLEHVSVLLQGAKMSQSSCMYPSKRCFPAPGGPVIHNLVGHNESVSGISFTSDNKYLVSASRDQTLRYAQN